MAIPMGKEAAAFKMVGVSTGVGGGGAGGVVPTGSFLHEAMANNAIRVVAVITDFISEREPYLFEPLKLGSGKTRKDDQDHPSCLRLLCDRIELIDSC